MAQLKSKELFIFVAIIFALWALRLYFFNLNEEMENNESLFTYLSILFRFLIYVLGVVLVVLFIEKEPLGQSTRLNTHLGLGLGIAAIIFLIGAVIQITASALTIDPLPDESALGIVDKVLVPAFFEEFFFRGYFLIRLMNTMSFHFANVITAILFVFFHSLNWYIVPGDITLAIMGIRVVILFFIIALPAGLLVQKTHSLWPSIAFHGIVNFITIP